MARLFASTEFICSLFMLFYLSKRVRALAHQSYFERHLHQYILSKGKDDRMYWHLEHCESRTKNAQATANLPELMTSNKLLSFLGIIKSPIREPELSSYRIRYSSFFKKRRLKTSIPSFCNKSCNGGESINFILNISSI